MNQEKKTIMMGPHLLQFKVEDIPNIFFTSDLHLNHANIIKYCKRPFKDVEEMNNTLINNLNNVLSYDSNSILINCGDVIFSHCSTYDDMMNAIKAKKIYNIIGNHDIKNIIQRRKMLPYDEKGRVFWSTELIIQIFDENNKLLTMFTCSHYPHCNGQFVGAFNIHGHLHTPDNVLGYTGTDIEIAKKLIDGGISYDVGVDGNEYKPISLMAILTGTCKRYNLQYLNNGEWEKRIWKLFSN